MNTNQFSTFNGVPVFRTPYAVTMHVSWELRRHPIAKRRRRWAAVRVESHLPACFRTPQGLFMHPAVFARLREHFGAHTLP
jgi:hypothetical protein